MANRNGGAQRKKATGSANYIPNRRNRPWRKSREIIRKAFANETVVELYYNRMRVDDPSAPKTLRKYISQDEAGRLLLSKVHRYAMSVNGYIVGMPYLYLSPENSRLYYVISATIQRPDPNRYRVR